MSVPKDLYTEYDWFAEARIRETAGNWNAAVEAYEEALRLNPSFAKAWYYKALAHLRLGQKKEATTCARKVVELKPEWEKFVGRMLK